ncbi:uncharacterized protein LOC142107321 isoform X2 [Mixophyes fleayi]|uniref:uncharacterized protein LOC142107321 isoform X2 n=1 Tax=Mixophyes fleayi TaxID=3061075 RepID=UPI003F4DBBF8
MVSVLGSLLVLSALVATGFSLACIQCFNSSGSSCTGPPVNCLTGQTCVSAYTVVTTGSSSNPQYSISCGATNQCNVAGSWTIAGSTVLTGTSCCNTDNCTSALPALPSQGTAQNGVTCRTCSSTTSAYCYTGDTLQCTGNETMCGLLTTQITGTITYSSALRGCTTPSYCNTLGTSTSSFSGLNVILNTYCSSGAVGLYAGFFFSTFAFLLTKLLF